MFITSGLWSGLKKSHASYSIWFNLISTRSLQCFTRFSVRYLLHRFKMHSDVGWEIARIQSMQILQALFLMDMLKSWLAFIFFFDYEFSVPNRKKNLLCCMWQVCMAEILTPKQREFRLSSACLNVLASFKLLVCLFSGVQWVGIFHQCSVG